MLEAALVFLAMMALFFALVDYSMAIFVQNVMSNAVREGVRFAITQQTGANGQDAAIKSVVQQYSLGFLNGSSGLAKISIQYYNSQTLAAVSGNGSNAQGNVCVVSINNYMWSWMAPLWRGSTQFAISTSASDVMEAPPNGVLPSR